MLSKLMNTQWFYGSLIERWLYYVCTGIAYGGGGAQFGGGNDLIFLDDVDCEGTEQSLLLCRTPPIGDHNCGPSENAGVFCPSTYTCH